MIVENQQFEFLMTFLQERFAKSYRLCLQGLRLKVLDNLNQKLHVQMNSIFCVVCWPSHYCRYAQTPMAENYAYWAGWPRPDGAAVGEGASEVLQTIPDQVMQIDANCPAPLEQVEIERP